MEVKWSWSQSAKQLFFSLLFFFEQYIPSQKAAAKGASGGKKALSGFMLFSKENRAKVKEENPDITFGGIGKKLGEMWRALSEKEKAAYKSDKA